MLASTRFVPLSTDFNGMVTWHSAVPADPALVGQTGFAQWFVADDSARGGVSASPAASFTVLAR